MHVCVRASASVCVCVCVVCARVRNLCIVILRVFLMSLILVCLCAVYPGFGVRRVSSLETTANPPMWPCPASYFCFLLLYTHRAQFRMGAVRPHYYYYQYYYGSKVASYLPLLFLGAESKEGLYFLRPRTESNKFIKSQFLKMAFTCTH